MKTQRIHGFVLISDFHPTRHKKAGIFCFLGLVKGLSGLLDKFIHSPLRVRIQADSHPEVDFERRPGGFLREGKGLNDFPNAFGPFDGPWPVRIRQDHGKNLFPAMNRKIDFSEIHFQGMSNFPQNALRSLLALGVRDFSEILDRTHEQGERVFLTKAPLHLKIEKILQIGAVIEAGDRFESAFIEIDFISMLKPVKIRLFF